MKSTEMVDEVEGLKPGKVDNLHFELLLDGTAIRGIEIIEALRDYLVNGVPLTEAWKKYDLNPSQFYRRLKVIQTESARVHTLSAYYKSPPETKYVPRLRSEVAAQAVEEATSKTSPKRASKATSKTGAKASGAAAGKKAAK